MAEMKELTDREINFQVAERVMGWTKGQHWGNGNGPWIVDGKQHCTFDTMPKFCRAIKAAMEVVNRMGHKPVSDTLEALDLATLSIHQYQNGQWLVNFVGKGKAQASTLEKAICLAALAAIEGRD